MLDRLAIFQDYAFKFVEDEDIKVIKMRESDKIPIKEENLWLECQDKTKIPVYYNDNHDRETEEAGKKDLNYKQKSPKETPCQQLNDTKESVLEEGVTINLIQKRMINQVAARPSWCTDTEQTLVLDSAKEMHSIADKESFVKEDVIATLMLDSAEEMNLIADEESYVKEYFIGTLMQDSAEEMHSVADIESCEKEDVSATNATQAVIGIKQEIVLPEWCLDPLDKKLVEEMQILQCNGKKESDDLDLVQTVKKLKQEMILPGWCVDTQDKCRQSSVREAVNLQPKVETDSDVAVDLVRTVQKIKQEMVRPSWCSETQCEKSDRETLSPNLKDEKESSEAVAADLVQTVQNMKQEIVLPDWCGNTNPVVMLDRIDSKIQFYLKRQGKVDVGKNLRSPATVPTSHKARGKGINVLEDIVNHDRCFSDADNHKTRRKSCHKSRGKPQNQKGTSTANEMPNHLEHLRKAHVVEHFECLRCLRQYRRKFHLLRHLREKHGFSRPQGHKASIPRWRIVLQKKGEESSRKHVPLENMDTPVKYRCPYCRKKFSGTFSLKRHQQSFHPQKTLMALCLMCGKELLNANLSRHMLIHSGEKPFKCRICGKSCTQSGDLHRHMRSRHPQKADARHKCKVCGKKFARKDVRDKHSRIHTKKCSYMCHLCGEKFVFKKYLKEHLKTHNM